MRLRFHRLAALGLGLSVGVLALPTTAGPAFNNKYDSTTTSEDCTDSEGETVGTITYNGPEYLWPPNHKMQAVDIVAADIDHPADDNDQVTLVVEISHEEYAEDGSELNGSGNTDVDSTTVGGEQAEDATAVAGEVRSERSGQGDGRTYTLDYQADFANGVQDPETYTNATCIGSFEVFVPHDMRGGAGWKHDTDGDGQGDNGKNGKP